MKITQNLKSIEIKSRDGLLPVMAFHYSARPDRDALTDTLRFMGATVRAVYASRKGEGVVNVALKGEADIDLVVASLNVPCRERRLRRY